MLLLYRLAIRCYGLAIRLAALGNPKARLWVQGRKGWRSRLQQAVQTDRTLLWFHCASLGEFEQGKPLMERFRSEMPEVFILVTFFSPSGYEMRKDYEGADHVSYLPLDTPSNARFFLKTVQPSAAFFVKYEFWFNFLRALDQQQVPLFIVAAQFRPSQVFFRSYGSFFRKQLRTVTHFFMQTEESAELLRKHGFEQVSVSGDTRVDRVAETVAAQEEVPGMAAFAKDATVLVVGSSWQPEEEYLLNWMSRMILSHKTVVAPHEVKEERLRKIQDKALRPVKRYFQSDPKEIGDAQTLLVDGVGLLACMYRYGDVAFVGGGFHDALHNILEPAAFGLPIVFGPGYAKNPEAVELVKLGGAIAVSNEEMFDQTVADLLGNVDYRNEVGAIAAAYVARHRGAVDRIFSQVQPAVLKRLRNSNATVEK